MSSDFKILEKIPSLIFFSALKRKLFKQVVYLKCMTYLEVSYNLQADSGWKVKYETMRDRLEDAAQTQAKYQALQSQYEALAALLKDSDTSSAVQVNLKAAIKLLSIGTEGQSSLCRPLRNSLVRIYTVYHSIYMFFKILWHCKSNCFSFRTISIISYKTEFFLPKQSKKSRSVL